MPIAELFLSEAVKTILNQLASGVVAKYARINGISEKLNNWKEMLQMIGAEMDSADEKQMRGDPAVDRWLVELREVIYNMEDLLDAFSVEAKRNASKAQSRWGNLPDRLISSLIKPHNLLSVHRTANEIEDVDQRLKEVFRRKPLELVGENSKSGSSGSSRIEPRTLLPVHRTANEIEEDDQRLEEVFLQKPLELVGEKSKSGSSGSSRIEPRTLLPDNQMAREIEEDDQKLEEVFLQKQLELVGENSKSGSSGSSRIEPRNLLSVHKMADEIEEIDQRLEEVFRQKPLEFVLENSKSWSSGSLRIEPRDLLSVDKMADEIEEIDQRLEEVFCQKPLELVVENSKSGSSGSSKIEPRTLHSVHQMADEIEEVDQRLEEVFHQKQLGLVVENSQSGSLTICGQPRFTPTSLPDPKFVGREKQMEKLMARLTGIEATDDVRPFTVISIVGMGGLGKTTLAQELYNHESVRKVFAVRAWTCVFDVFDMVAITRSILECIAPSLSYKGKDLKWLQGSIKEQLSGKKFLIVLDDVWNEKYNELDSLLKPFYSGSRGSRILLTTQNRRVAHLVGDRDPALLDLMSLNECFSLIAYHATGEINFESHPYLHDIAVQLAEKCEGLPLAAKTIGGFLHSEFNEEKWKEVLDDDIWKGEGEYVGIPRALELSYLRLPNSLKRCFAVCALFPKDYPFDRDELIQLWIAQGLLDGGTAKTYREVGLEYIRQLEARSLLHKVDNEKTRYSMHFMNNLAKSVAGVTCFNPNEHRNTSGESSLEKVLHAALLTQYFERCLSRRVDEYCKMKKLRTFMPFQISAYSFSNISISNKVLHDLVVGFKCLRVLSFRCFHIRYVPDKIGELKLLRSIDFSYTLLEVLPNSICSLVDLQYLLLQGCMKLKKLPRNIHKLSKLLHLDITGASRLREMPPHIGDLTNLEILSSFVVGKEVGQQLKELGPLKGLRRELHIRNLQAVDAIEDATIANLEEKEGISELSFDFRSNAGISRNESHQLMLLDHLQPPKKIKSFSISGYGGKKFPSWFDIPFMNNVVSITMEDCVSVESLPPFGRLPLLEKLNISGLEGVSKIGHEFYGTPTPFRSLSSLSFRGMLSWEEWSSCGDCENDQPFPCLRELTMVNCPKLMIGLPGKLGSLFKLDIRDCPLLKTSHDSLSLPSLGEMYFECCDDRLLKCLVDVTSMTKIVIRNVPQLDHFDGSNWVSLEEIQIHKCPRFKSLIHGNGGKQVPPKLKNLVIRDCKRLKKLPDDLCRLESLKEMTIASCRKLSSFAGWPPTLSKLELADCPSLLASQFRGMRLPESLEELTLNNLKGLVSVEDIIVESHPSRYLRKLNIYDCRSLKTLPPACLQHLSSLSEISVSRCKELELNCFPALPCNLSRFELVECPKVKSLPNDMHSLTSLKDVTILSCPSITGLPIGGLPPQLEWLHIGRCEKLDQPLKEWGLARLTALQQLHIVGGMECVDEMECFPSGDYGNAWRGLLPSSLVVLDICFMEKLKRLACGLSTHLTSLQELRIGYCGKMRHLPGDGLPDSLEVIEISGCDLLEKKFSEPDGDYLPLLERIPEVIIY